MKQILWASLVILSASLMNTQTRAEDTKTKQYQPELLIFAGDLRVYVEKAKALAQQESENASPEGREALVAELQATGKRLAKVYFDEAADVIKNELDAHLSLALKENRELKNYFIFMGNAFAEIASALLHKYQAHQSKIRLMWIGGGAAVGVAMGGGYLFFRLKRAAQVALSSKDYLIAAGAVVAGTAIGFGWGTHAAGSLPMDTSVTNAKAFSTKYPHGEDFIQSLNRSSDLKLLASELGE